MPKFAPNTGFKMPGVGSKNIDSPGNFRDEQHVDKVGYCDTTEDSMLPEGSSPLKARYTTTGYRKDIDVLELPKAKAAAQDDVYEKTETIEGAGNETEKEPVTSSDSISYGMDQSGPTRVLGSDQAGTGNSYDSSFSNLKKDEQGNALATGDFSGGNLNDWTTYVKDHNANKNATTVAGETSFWTQKNGGPRQVSNQEEYDDLTKKRQNQQS
jgi:hypothetical protein|tara:strand:- start:42 stop:677 length:636 start_codon:yes stop_codon:yes gene_type:complete